MLLFLLLLWLFFLLLLNKLNTYSSNDTVHFKTATLFLSLLSGMLSKWKLELKCQAGGQNQFQVPSWASFVEFFISFSRWGKAKEGMWVLLLHCHQKGEATVMLLFYASCGQSVFVLRYHQQIFFFLPLVSHRKTLLKGGSPLWSEPPLIRTELCSPTETVPISELRKNALAASCLVCSRVH